MRNFYRYQSGIDHSLIDLESGMVNWYLRIPLSSLILLSSDGAVFSRDPCIGLLQCSGKRKNMAGNGRKQPEKVRQEKRWYLKVEWLFWGMQVSVGGLEGT